MQEFKKERNSREGKERRNLREEEKKGKRRERERRTERNLECWNFGTPINLLRIATPAERIGSKLS